MSNPAATQDEPLRRHRVAVMLGLLIAAFVFRAAYFIDYAATLPFAGSPIADSLVYLQQARDLAQDARPSPALIAFSPLYGYVLCAAMKPIGPVLVLLLQMLLGTALVGVVYGVVRRRFGDAAGLASALLLMSYGVLVYFESKLLSDSIGIVLAFAALIVFTSEGVARGRAFDSFASGTLAALAVLARASLIFGLPMFVLAALLPRGSGPRSLRPQLVRTSAFCLGMALVLCGNGLLNLQRSGRFVPVIMVSDTVARTSSIDWDGNLTSASAEQAPTPFDVVEQARRKLMQPEGSASSPSLVDRMFTFDLLGIVATAPGKIAQTFRNRESSYQYGFQSERHAIDPLRLLPSSFGLIMLWGLWGAVLLWRRQGPAEVAAYAPWFLGCLVTVVLFHPSTRYRLGMVPGAILLGGFAIVETWRARASSRGRFTLAALVLLSAVAIGHSYALGPGNRGEWNLQIAFSHGLAGRHTMAREYAQRALDAAPDDPSVAFRARTILEQAPREDAQ